MPVIQEWEGSPYQKWAKNFCNANQWRVSHTIGEFEDCLAECALVYVETLKRYPTVEEPKHFMSLFKLSTSCWFHDCSNKNTKFTSKVVIDHNMNYLDCPNTVESDSNLAVRLREASSELSQVLNIFFSAPQEMMNTLRASTGPLPRQFFKEVVKNCGMSEKQSVLLARELQALLA